MNYDQVTDICFSGLLAFFRPFFFTIGSSANVKLDVVRHSVWLVLHSGERKVDTTATARADQLRLARGYSRISTALAGLVVASRSSIKSVYSGDKSVYRGLARTWPTVVHPVQLAEQVAVRTLGLIEL